ncbi:MAG: O-antigen polymerase [Chloroflexota bacterium]
MNHPLDASDMLNIKRFNVSPFALLAGGLLAALPVFIYVMVNKPSLALSLLGSILYTAMLVMVGWRLVRASFDLFSPVVFMGVFFLLTYPVKGIYILFARAYGPFVTQNYRFTLDARLMGYFAGALALSAFCCFTFLWIINTTQNKQRGFKLLLAGRAWHLDRVFLLMLLISFFLSALFVWLIVSAGGMRAYLQSVASRQLFFYGRYYIYILIDLFPEVSCFFLAALYERWKSYPRPVLVSAFIVVAGANLLVSLLAGNRSTFLIGFLIPVMIFWHYRIKPIRLAQATVAVVVVLFASILYIGTFRGGNVAERLTLANLQGNIATSFRNISSLMFGGPDLVQFDVLMVTMQEIPANHPYFAGDSLKALAAFPIPRALYPDKPVRGNWLFTEAIFPAWRVNLSGFTVSYLGDWYMNFGVVGAIVGITLLALGLRYLFSHLNPHLSWVNAVFYGLVVSSSLTVIRSDIFSLINFGLTLLFAVMITLFCSTSKQAASQGD